MIPARFRNVAAIGVVGWSLAFSIPAMFVPPVMFTGITLRDDDGSLVVDAVAPRSSVYGRILPGENVVDINYTLVKDIPEKALPAFVRGDFLELGVPDPAGGWTQWTFPPVAEIPIGFVFVVGLGLLFGIAIWVARGLAGEVLRPVALPLATASSLPLILAPAAATLTWPAVVAAVSPATLALLLLADGFITAIAPATRRLAAAAIALAAAIGSVGMSLALIALDRSHLPGALPSTSGVPDPVMWLLGVPGLSLGIAAAITLGPAAILLTSRRRASATSGSTGAGRSRDRLPILIAASTPFVMAAAYSFGGPGIGLSVAMIWLLIAVIILQTSGRFDILRIQRDTVVAATEIERARLAADLHDDALQEMTVLVRRLDDVGDARAAELARSIADRLREVCGELRLPILDELGAGPALEWLVERVGEASGRQVQLERGDAARPPADVELAVFRVAQEALANAVAHGAPPIVVRYEASSDRASLSIRDHGAGMSADAAMIAGRSGHYGLLNMRQRAEQIGARIDFRQPPDGGTVIGMVWAPA